MSTVHLQRNSSGHLIHNLTGHLSHQCGTPNPCVCCADVFADRALRFDVGFNAVGMTNGSCSRCSAVNQGWRRATWKALCYDNFGCTYTSLFEIGSNTVLCSGVQQYQGARLSFTCDPGSPTNLVLTLQMLYNATLVAPSLMNVAATYQSAAPLAGPVNCNGLVAFLNYVSDNGACGTWPATLFVTGSNAACP